MDKEIKTTINTNLLDVDLASSEEYQDKYLIYVGKLNQLIKK